MVKLRTIVHNANFAQAKGITYKDELSKGGNAVARVLDHKLSTIGVLLTGMDSKQQAEFANQAAALVTKDEFLDELQERIGTPQKNETEDIFVSRAKNRMRELLKEKLK